MRFLEHLATHLVGHQDIGGVDAAKARSARREDPNPYVRMMERGGQAAEAAMLGAMEPGPDRGSRVLDAQDAIDGWRQEMDRNPAPAGMEMFDGQTRLAMTTAHDALTVLLTALADDRPEQRAWLMSKAGAKFVQATDHMAGASPTSISSSSPAERRRY